MEYAIIALQGKQYRLSVGHKIEVPGVYGEVGKTVELGEVLLVKDGSVTVGKPKIDEKVSFSVLEHGKSKKIRVFKYKSKSRYRRTNGHRQAVTVLEFLGLGAAKKTAKKSPASTAKSKAETPVKKEKTVKAKPAKKAEVKKTAPAKKAAPKKEPAKKAAAKK